MDSTVSNPQIKGFTTKTAVPGKTVDIAISGTQGTGLVKIPGCI